MYSNIVTKITFKDSSRKIYAKKPISNSVFGTYSFNTEKTAINKFFKELNKNDGKTEHYLDKRFNKNIDGLKKYKSFKYLNLHKFNNVTSFDNVIQNFVLVSDEQKRSSIAKISLMYNPDLHSDYKILNIEFIDKKSFAKHYKL